MACRSVRKIRHHSNAPKTFSFKQRVQMGQITGKLNRKEITLEEIAADERYSWMIQAWNEIKNEAIAQIEEMVSLPPEYPFQFNEPEQNNESQ